MDWKLTRNAIGEAQVDDYRQDDEGEDLRLGYSMLRELARSDDTLVEIAPGVWRHSKFPEDHNQRPTRFEEP